MSNTTRKDKNGKEYKESLKKKDGHYRCRCEYCLGKKDTVDKIAERELKEELNKMGTILEIATEKGRLREGQFITYKGDTDCKVYSIASEHKFTCFYPSEDGCLITIDVDDSELEF